MRRAVQSQALPIPHHELDTFLLTVNGAVELAEEGQAAEGYSALLAGVERAREAAEVGEPWGGELVRRWQDARDRYAERYQIGRDGNAGNGNVKHPGGR